MKQLAVNQLMIKGAPDEPVQIVVKGAVIGTFYPLGTDQPASPEVVAQQSNCEEHIIRIAELEGALQALRTQSTQLASAFSGGDRYGHGRPYSKADQLGKR